MMTCRDILNHIACVCVCVFNVRCCLVFRCLARCVVRLRDVVVDIVRVVVRCCSGGCCCVVGLCCVLVRIVLRWCV